MILNKCYGGFRPSVFAYNEHAKRNGIELFWYHPVGKYDHGYAVYKLTNEPGFFDRPITKYLGRRIKANDIDRDCVYHLEEASREDADLIDIVEQYGERASSSVSNLVVVEIPDCLAGRYIVDEYDGFETLHENVPIWSRGELMTIK